MITKLRNAQDSWLAKAILGLTALSFVSLFGITGYINSAATNPTVIKVNNLTVSKQEFDYQVDQEIRTARNLIGEDFEVTEELRKVVVASLLKKNLTNMITEEAAIKYNVYISDDLIRGIIYSQVQFLNEDGSFNMDRFKYFLSQSNWSEQKYIENIRTDLKKQFLVSNPVSNINVPKVLLDYVAKSESQRKEFKYITVDSANIKIDRQISEDETNQFYEDFEAEFTEPESRDVTFAVLALEDLADKSEVSEDEIKEYYQANIHEFVIPETREVLQMVFDNQDTAKQAFDRVKQGEDFYEVALEMAKQPRAETELDYVSKDMLLEEIADEVFSAPKGKVVGPMESELGWHIMKVADIKAGSKVDDNIAKAKAIAAIKNEKVYDTAYEVVRNVDDMIGSGQSLAEVAKNLGIKTYKASGIKENGDVASFPDKFPLLMYNNDFLDTVFSYNEGEISQAVETDEGYVFVMVDKINDSHLLAKEDVLPKIQKIWAENERSAIALEIVSDVTHDLESGDKIDEVAKRYNLKLNSTGPLTRAETFANITPNQMLEIFNDELNTPKTYEKGSRQIVAVAVANATPKALTEDDMDILKRRLSLDIQQSAAAQLVDAYGKTFDIRVKDRILGLTQ